MDVAGLGVLAVSGLVLLLNGEVLQGWEALHVVLCADGSVFLDSAVDLANVNDVFRLVSQLVPGGRELLAVAAPGGVEFDEPAVAFVGNVLGAVVNESVEIGGIEGDSLRGNEDGQD